MAGQPDFNQLRQAYQTITNQMGLIQNMPAIQGQQYILNEIRRLDVQGQTRHNQLVGHIQQLTAQTRQLAAQTQQLTAQTQQMAAQIQQMTAQLTAR